MTISYFQYERIENTELTSFIVEYNDMEPNNFCVIRFFRNKIGSSATYYKCIFEANINDTLIRMHEDPDEIMEDITYLLRTMIGSKNIYYIRDLEKVEAVALIQGNISLREFETTISAYNK